MGLDLPGGVAQEQEEVEWEEDVVEEQALQEIASALIVEQESHIKREPLVTI
jgi:hypothetical protein